jgi:hypothetical protein
MDRSVAGFREDPSVFVVGASHVNVTTPLLVTVSVADPVMLPDIAVIVVKPAARDVAKPLEPAALLIAAIAAVDEYQVTAVVKFCVVLSEYVPVAVNCCVVPLRMLGFVGVTAMDTSVAEVTVSVVDPDLPPDIALIVVEPAVAEVASPLDPAELLMAATAAVDEYQVTAVVRSCVVLSENVPVALNCCVVPLTMLGLVGVTAMDTSVAEVTVIVADPDMFPDVAVIVVEPTAAEVARPLVAAAPLMAATAAADEFQVTSVVRSCVVPSENVPVAVNCCAVPRAMFGLAGVIARETSFACVTVTPVHPDVFPHFPQILVLPQRVAVMYPER